MDKKVTIVTHDGMFHSDDVFAVASLLCLLDKTPVLTTIVRTRDEDMIRKADFVVDVGAVHDAKNNRFDHHQTGGAGKRDNSIPYASFGLVWQKFGKDISGSDRAAKRIDEKLVASIDAGDNGVDIYKKVFPNTLPYLINDHIHNLRPTFKEAIETLDERFLEAVAFARKVLEREIAHINSNLVLEEMVRKVYESTEDKRVLVFDSFYPRRETLSGFPEPLFIVHPRIGGMWGVEAVRDDVSLYKNRKDLPETWAGKRDQELADITGVPDATFCHNGRFMAVAKSREGAITLARLALNS